MKKHTTFPINNSFKPLRYRKLMGGLVNEALRKSILLSFSKKTPKPRQGVYISEEQKIGTQQPYCLSNSPIDERTCLISVRLKDDI